MREIRLRARREAIAELTAWVDAELEQAECSPKAQMQIDVAIDEIMANIVMYAYPGREGNVTVRYSREGRIAEMTFIDEGIPYNPLDNPEPDVTLSAEERKIGGLGIFLVKKMADEVSYRYEDGKNILTIRKRI